jgi:heme exporter protein B
MSVPFWSQTAELVKSDLRSELRSGEVLAITIPFGAVALLLIPFAIGTDVPLLRQIGPGMYWAVVLLFGMLVALRRTASEGQGQRDLIGMLGVDPAAHFTGRAAATAILIVAFELVLWPVAIALYDARASGWAWTALLIPLVAIGLALLTTVVGSIASRSGSGPTLVPLLVAPLAIPLLLAATQVHEALRLGESILGWLTLMVTMNLVLAVASVLSARPIQEAQ